MIRMMVVWTSHWSTGNPIARLVTEWRLLNPAHIRYLQATKIFDPGLDARRDIVRVFWAQENANTTDTLATLDEWEALLKEARL